MISMRESFFRIRSSGRMITMAARNGGLGLRMHRATGRLGLFFLAATRRLRLSFRRVHRAVFHLALGHHAAGHAFVCNSLLLRTGDRHTRHQSHTSQHRNPF